MGSTEHAAGEGDGHSKEAPAGFKEAACEKERRLAYRLRMPLTVVEFVLSIASQE